MNPNPVEPIQDTQGAQGDSDSPELHERSGSIKSFTYVQSKPIDELFDMVYMWGRVGVVVDSKAPAFQDKLMEVVRSFK